MRKLLAVFITAFMAAVLGPALTQGCAAGGDTDENDDNCTVGAEGCTCTNGGACDPGLQCLSDICVDPGGGTGGSGAGAGGSGSGGMDCVPDGEGCQAVDVLFALDSSGSMSDENGALAATQAFQQIATTIDGINCGQVDYRIGVTSDYTPSFFVPSGWTGSAPWFDSQAMSGGEIAAAFTGAANQVMATGQTPTGCEHVLTNATSLVTTDNTGFVREGALLVLVLVSDADDYGEFDMVGNHSCTGFGCTETSQTVQSLYDSLLALKGGEPAALATVIVAGDPSGTADFNNLCGQPGACTCDGVDCPAYQASRLYDFAGQVGTHGVTADICAGAASVPTAVEVAFATQIDLACQELEPPK
jgi:hypothetical protein